MKLIAVVVISIDGRITKGNNGKVFLWSSKEDQRHFRKIKKNAKAIIYGRVSYENDKQAVSDDTRLIVHTRTPSEFTSSEQVTFTSKSPKEVLSILEGENHDEIFLFGGGKIYSMYLEARVVDELWLTLEPKIHGKGTNFIATQKPLDVRFELQSVTNLNKSTLLIKYKKI